ncbi:MAG: hypothetical protein R3Y26_04245 [Rikenellaceae bacterium]
MKAPLLKFIYLSVFTSSLLACTTTEKPGDVISTINFNKTISTDYIGNGVQWDPYSEVEGMGESYSISDSDWEKLYDRVDNMSPDFIRVMFNTVQMMDSKGNFNPEQNMEHLAPILDYCQSRAVNVMFGDWGGAIVDKDKNAINKELIDYAVEYADYLINKKGYDCIKYYNLINEPNGWWSITGGDYNLWIRAAKHFHKKMVAEGLNSKLKLVGPDIAIWDKTENWWIDSCANQKDNMIGLYDIHTYPAKSEVNSGKYGEIVGAYRDRIPKGKQIVMGEIGLKFQEKDPEMDKINKERIAKVEHAAESDSQMFVFDHFYGTDMADVLVQTLNEGYSGSIIWMLDDAMHTNPVDGKGKLKIWGFWNILGEEHFGGVEHEKVRPPYYAWSLLCKYIPSGSQVLETTTTGVEGVKVAATQKDDKYTIILVNVTDSTHTITLNSESLAKIENVKQFNYIEGDMILEGDNKQLPNREGLTINLNRGANFELPSASMIVLTNLSSAKQ